MKVVILSDFSTSEKIQDGMMQRIYSIDKELSHIERMYLCVTYRLHFLRPKKRQLSSNSSIYYLNFFSHFFLIKQILKKNEYVYIHSLYNYIRVSSLLTNKTKNILDVHGVVPEELEFYGDKKRAKKYKKKESKLFNLLYGIVFVSNKMKDFYLQNYPQIETKKIIIKPILPLNSLCSSTDSEIEKIKKQYNLSDDYIYFIYCGGLQKWQNFDLILDTFEKINLQNKFLIVLSQYKNQAFDIVKKKLKAEMNFLVLSVRPEDLNMFYSLANYGFLLRDDHLLNSVAAPTKLIEYLFYGITPILLSRNIGDIDYYQYEYILLEKIFNTNLMNYKSKHNVVIAKKIINDVTNSNFLSLFQ